MSSESAHRAAAAASSVRQLFGRRLFGIPGTYLPHVALPSRGRFGSWHYWWLAHFLDCLLDEAERERATGSTQRAGYAGTRALQLLRTIRIRNGLRFANHYYDDMAWLLVAVQRLRQIPRSLPPGPAARRLTDTAYQTLSAAVLAGEDPELGGVYWNDQRDFKNVAATGPVAIYLARAGDPERARRLVEWVYRTLFDAQSGLVLDGVRRGSDGTWSTAGGRFTYNQGVLLGTLVTLGDPASNDRATSLIEAMHAHLAVHGDHETLVTHDGHDGGLFTGIAARYLALAARSPVLDPPARERAGRLVRGTADALWDGRREYRPAPNGIPAWIFSPDPARPAAQTQPPGTVVELSTQVQAWTILEAAATVE